MKTKDLLEVKIESHDNFKIIIETLTRMGTADKEKKKLTQACFLLKVIDTYYIVHYKEIQKIINPTVEVESEDYAMRNTVATLLENWKMLVIKSRSLIEEGCGTLASIFVASHKRKQNWVVIKHITLDELKKAQHILEEEREPAEPEI